LVDRALRKLSKQSSKSLNQFILEIIERAVSAELPRAIYTDLDSLAGSWIEDPKVDAALVAQSVVDRELWK